jgi:tetratricopeptide (TPR) repeat protein
MSAVFKGWDHMSRVHLNGSELELARAAFADALARQPGNPRAMTGMAAYHVVSAQLLRGDADHHFGVALTMLQTVVTGGGGSPSTFSLLGQIHKHYGRTTEALHQFEHALAIDSSNAAVHAQIGHTLINAGRGAEGIERIHHAIRLSPNDPLVPVWLGFAAGYDIEQGNVEAAIVRLEDAARRAPSNWRNAVLLAAAYALAGRRDDADRQVRNIRTLMPHLTDGRLTAEFGVSPHRPRLRQGLLLAIAAAAAN